MNWVEPGERLQVYNNNLFSQDVHVFVSTRLLNKSMQIIIFTQHAFLSWLTISTNRGLG